ncbi:MAG: mannose-1-phosphate guanylyltransferase [Treponema sp.]|jgi:mannose-1-phosphate guanylyltransferase/mannose-1-phosphate guanylyltransferase/mannose-6-phosphate isomerase|nr:mannose-1-phosphate guanylyltransferase [Treponema sp.]
MFDYCIIMAGGSGTRLWPASNSRTPKQFLSMGPSRGTFFNAALDRALSVIDRDGRIIIIAGRSHTAHVVKACGAYSPGELERMLLIPEPAAKNTAPAIACAVQYIRMVSGGAARSVLVLTSDHVITPLEAFKADAAAAAASARADKLAVFGIGPSKPETGYGYIEAEKQAAKNPGVFTVRAFHEKPEREKAEAYLRAGTFYWNSGMFAFSSQFINGEFGRSAPEVMLPFTALGTPEEGAFAAEQGLRILEWPGLEEAYGKTRAVSFDYAIAEKCPETVMVPAAFNWTDVGSWDEYAALAAANTGDLNFSGGGGVFQSGSRNCFVDSDMPVALAGVEDLIVAVRSGKNGGPGAVLIAKRGDTQRVREIVEQIKAAGRGELL